ncbi:hypothetical protein [Jannaschia sp. 2305UL9-9]|uniref:hypothetical protein n=1 Tax=Jannaschia sp. 2305UL9-9 TaxID=3121638 RepID=UPI00352996E2
MIQLSARGIAAEWEAASGHLPRLTIGGADVLFAAPWRSDAGVQSDASIPVVDRRLGGTFACAPFGADDVDGGPPHGRGANGPWQVIRTSPSALTAWCPLSRGQMTARIALRDDHPALYQTHVLDLEAPCTFAHHPMVQITGGGRLSAATPRAILTFDAEAPVFDAHQRSTLWQLTANGRSRDVRDLPQERCEDFLTLVSGGRGLGWTALRRFAEGDTILTLRRADQLPVTMLWLSNGARQNAPWCGQVRGLIGIEDGIGAGAAGFAAALSARSRVAAEGVATALAPGRHVIPHAILRLDRPVEVSEVTLDRGLRIDTPDGPVHLPFDESHFA